ncbi:MAG: cupin domain-containing protein [Bryobacterales bacterium]
MVIPNAASRAVFRAEKMGKADLFSADALFAGLNCFEPGQEHALHTHAGQDKIYYILEGEGDVIVGEETTRVKAGDLVLAKSEEPHAMANPGPERLVVMVVMAPPPAAKK